LKLCAVNIIRKILLLYQDVFRPIAVKNRKISNTLEEFEALILNYDGKPVKNVGALVTRFYEREANLHVTTTGI
jgi:hypothetical protein